MDDQKHLLHYVIDAAVAHSEPAGCAPHEVEVSRIDFLEAEGLDRAAVVLLLLSRSLGGIDGCRPRERARRETCHVTNLLAAAVTNCDLEDRIPRPLPAPEPRAIHCH
jgi:hypothetical protein